MHQELETSTRKLVIQQEVAKMLTWGSSDALIQLQSNFKDSQEWEQHRRQLYVVRKATVKRTLWNKLSVLPLLHSALLATAIRNLHALRFKCSKIHLSFYSQLTAGAAERCESLLSYINTGYNMRKFTQFSLLQGAPR